VDAEKSQHRSVSLQKGESRILMAEQKTLSERVRKKQALRFRRASARFMKWVDRLLPLSFLQDAGLDFVPSTAFGQKFMTEIRLSPRQKFPAKKAAEMIAPLPCSAVAAAAPWRERR